MGRAVLIVFYRVSLVGRVLDLAQLGSAEDHSEWLLAMLGISTLVRQVPPHDYLSD
jgi:hypothetical protein